MFLKSDDQVPAGFINKIVWNLVAVTSIAVFLIVWLLILTLHYRSELKETKWNQVETTRLHNALAIVHSDLDQKVSHELDQIYIRFNDIEQEHEKLVAQVEILDESINGAAKKKARINTTIAAIKAMLPAGGNPLPNCPTVPTPGELWSIAGAIIDNADYYAVSPSLIAAIIRQESAFCNKAVSAAGAKGYMQLMPDTAAQVSADVAVKTNRALRTWRGRDNIQLGTAYLSQMLMEFDGDIRLAAAGYNAGPNHVKKVIAGERQGYHAETKNYIEAVVAYKEEFKKLGLR